MSTQVERPATREQHSVSPAGVSGARQQTVAGRTPGPARSFVVAAVFAEFARAVEGGDTHGPQRLVDTKRVAHPKASAVTNAGEPRRPRDPRPNGGAA